jgi:hypothetical protein
MSRSLPQDACFYKEALFCYLRQPMQKMNRRSFVKSSALSGAGLITGPGLLKNISAFGLDDKLLSLNGNRFVTLCIMIRTTPWEVSRDVKLLARDEYEWHTLEGVKALRNAFAKNNPNGRLTWGFTLNALEDQRKNYREIRDYAVECQNKYGDEVSYFPGYFPAMYLPRERINREMSEAIHIISDFVGNLSFLSFNRTFLQARPK